ncbi:helix-turn-helix domain-containing protein [Pseudonocardia alni]|uniref:helix-turn-helix domain-containing protein n=1 Tax=Pseudonocardia alni TaxID=33907 RepID=UPI00280B99B6|nr:helix-turn-helix transcriptional regulator [Pseudonocardia alni]
MSDTATGVIAALALIKGTKLEKCKRLQVNPTTLDRWRNGVGEPTEANLARLARLAGVDQEWIRAGGRDIAED